MAEISGPSLEVELIPFFDQILHGETYTFIIKFNSTGNGIEQSEAVTGQPGLVYTGNYLVSLTFSWRGKGSYDFGDATTGYTYNLDNIELNRSLTFPESGSTVTLRFNHTFDRDSFQFGMKPYEDIEIVNTVSIYYEIRNSSSGIIVKGPRIGSFSTEYYLIDDIQVDYLKGKYQDMQSEIVNLDKVDSTQTFQKSRYYKLLEQMNNTLNDGDYLEAKEIYLDYDEDSRAELISDLANEANNSLHRIEELKDLRAEVANLEIKLDVCELDYENLESRYNALSNAYQREQAELEALRRNLTTAITAVFLASVLFFFLGRRSIAITKNALRGES
jgi:hypothetical protein